MRSGRLIMRAALTGAAGLLFALVTEALAEKSDSSPSRELMFLSENNVAMDHMMTGMAAKPTGDVDADFVATMIPHHQGAIDMAIAELRYGRNEKLRRLAQEIVVEQQQEISVMRLSLGQSLSPAKPSPTQRGNLGTNRLR